MPALTRKKRYRGGDLSVSDVDGFPRHLSIGEEMPADVLATLCKGEIDSMLGCGMLREIGAPPPPRPAPEPATPLTAVDILRTRWSAAGPRGYAITVLDKAARESDLKRVTEDPTDRSVLVHRAGGELVATVWLTRLAQLLAMSGFGAR